MKEIFKLNFRSVLSLVLVAAMVLVFAGCKQKTESSQKGSFKFEVVELDGSKEEFTVEYDGEKSIGEALEKEGLVEGNDSQFGLEVHTVNGQKYTYDDDKVYWAFYIDGEYAMTGVDSTPIEDGKIYCFKAEKA